MVWLRGVWCGDAYGYWYVVCVAVVYARVDGCGVWLARASLVTDTNGS